MGNLQNSILNRSKKQGDFRNTAILALGNGYLWFDRVMVMMAFPFVLPAFGLTLSQGGLIVSAMAIGFIICGLVFGNISDRIGRRKVYIPAIAVFSVGGFLTGLAGNIIALAGIRAVVCGAEGAYNSAAQAQVSERSMPEKKGRNMGFYAMVGLVSVGFLAPIYATTVGTALGWKWIFYLTIIPGIIVFTIITLMLREPKGKPAEARESTKNKGKPKYSFREILKEKNIIVCIIIAMFAMTWQWSWSSYGLTFFINERGLDPVSAGFVMSAFGVGGASGTLLVPVISDKVGRKPMIIISAVIGFIGTLSVVFGSAFLPATAVFILFTIAAFAGNGIFPIFLTVSPTESVNPALAATTIGLVTSIGETAGIAVAPPIFGAIGDRFGLDMTMTVASCALLIVLIAGVFLRETAPVVLNRRRQTIAE